MSLKVLYITIQIAGTAQYLPADPITAHSEPMPAYLCEIEKAKTESRSQFNDPRYTLKADCMLFVGAK